MSVRSIRRSLLVAVALATLSAPAAAQTDPCVDDAEGSAAGQQVEECSEVLPRVLVRPDQAAPEPLPVTGADAVVLLVVGGAALASGGGALTVARRRRAQA